MFGRKVHIYRTTATIGLIRARLFAARVASGDVIVMLDAHMEVQEKWLVIGNDDSLMAVGYFQGRIYRRGESVSQSVC